MSKNAKCGHIPTKRGVSKGGRKPPFGTQPCLQGVMCYTCRRGWREKCGSRMMDTHILSDWKTGGILRIGMSKIPFGFISGGGYTKLPSIVLRRNFGTFCPRLPKLF